MIVESAEAIVDGLIQIMNVHDAPTAAHLDATGQLAYRLARRLDLDGGTSAKCGVAARLHDISKIALPAPVLNRASSLSGSERAAMRAHPEKGYQILAAIPQLEDLAPIVRWHHERMDGRGYPDGLIGEEIPIECRLIAVVDAFHEMTVPRPYRRAIAVNDALQELLECSGSQFDEEVAHAFVDMFARPDRAHRISA